jgi:hypothetical protein
MTKTIPRIFPDINLFSTTANEIKTVIHLSKKMYAVMMEYQQNNSKLAQNVLIFL